MRHHDEHVRCNMHEFYRGSERKKQEQNANQENTLHQKRKSQVLFLIMTFVFVM